MTKKSNNFSKKGGTRFPRYSLNHLAPLLESLIGKTHTSGIDIEQLNVGVFGMGAKSSRGKVKCSALKQFGLLDGTYDELDSTTLTKKIVGSEGNEKIKLLKNALENVEVFQKTFETFQNSTTKKSKIANYAVSSLDIHPEKKNDFVKMFLESAEVCDLCKSDGDTVDFAQNINVSSQENDDTPDSEKQTEDKKEGSELDGKNPISQTPIGTKNKQKRGKSDVNVNIDVDPSMDPEKLEKLLKLLKTYDAI